MHRQSTKPSRIHPAGYAWLGGNCRRRQDKVSFRQCMPVRINHFAQAQASTNRIRNLSDRARSRDEEYAMSEEQPKSPQPDPKQRRINIDLPKGLRAVYANVALISHTPAEVMIDFAQVLPRSPRGSVEARVIMTPMHAKMLHLALAQNIANYERQFGEIRLPQRSSTLADSFFRFSQEGDGDENDDNPDKQ